MILSIIIVSWNVKDKLRENLAALLKSKVDFEYEIIVVDNNSEDGTIEMVEKEFPDVSYIANEANLGFAKANNIAMKQIESDYVLLLNPDMRVRDDTLGKALNWLMRNPRASVAGCRLTDPAGNTIRQVRRFPSVWNQLSIILKLPHIFKRIIDHYLFADFDYTRSARVDSIRGSFFLIAMHRVRELDHFLDSTLPFFDDNYFLWFEEVDYCRQIKKAGGEVWYTPAAECTDLVGQSFKQVKLSTTQNYMRDSMIKYFRKWHPFWQYLALQSAWVIGKAMAVWGEKAGVKPRAKT